MPDQFNGADPGRRARCGRRPQVPAQAGHDDQLHGDLHTRRARAFEHDLPPRRVRLDEAWHRPAAHRRYLAAIFRSLGRVGADGTHELW